MQTVPQPRILVESHLLAVVSDVQQTITQWLQLVKSTTVWTFPSFQRIRLQATEFRRELGMVLAPHSPPRQILYAQNRRRLFGMIASPQKMPEQ